MVGRLDGFEGRDDPFQAVDDLAVVRGETCVQALKTGTHELIVNDPRQVVNSTDQLAHAIAALG